MTSRRAASVRAIASIATALSDLRHQVVFVGGTVAALYTTDEGVDIRPTVDVDCVVNVATMIAYYAFMDMLRARGFADCTDQDAPLRRLVHGGIRVDVMPSVDTAMGPTNRWYADAMRVSAEYDADGIGVRAITPIYFIATKLEAFRGRGGGDYMASHDLEDLLAVLAALPSVRDEIASARDGVALAVRQELAEMVSVEEFVDAVPGHFDGHAVGQERARRIATWLRTLRGE